MTEQQHDRAFDLGVADEHVPDPSQSAPPEAEDDATAPSAEGPTTIEAPGEEPVGGGPSGLEALGDDGSGEPGDEVGPAFE